MAGEVWYNDTGWWYSEKIYRNGQYIEYQMVSRCHVTNGASMSGCGAIAGAGPAADALIDFGLPQDEIDAVSS
jgi:hypothetical protein